MTNTELSTFDRIAAPYDRGMAPLERFWLRRMRRKLLSHAWGRVLEIGVGTGANLPFYPPATYVMAVDESVDMLKVATNRAGVLQRPVRFGQVDAEHLAFPAASFDTVLASLVLCSVVDQRVALRELWRVLHKPAGKLLLLEHMRPQPRPLAWMVDLANIPWYGFNGRCNLNRRTQQAVEENGFRVEKVDAALGGFFRLIVAEVA